MRNMLVVAALAAGCHKVPSPGAATGDADALWALAPEGATIGVIATPRAIAMLDHAWHDVRGVLASDPELAQLDQMLRGELRRLGVGAAAGLADLGLAPGKGFASFALDDGSVLTAYPVVDRDRFVALSQGTRGSDVDQVDTSTCKPVNGYYLCASNPRLFAGIGKGKLRGQLSAAGARGDVELVVDGAARDEGFTTLAAVAQLESGTIVVRGSIAKLALLDKLLGPPTKPRVDLARSAGFALIDVRPLMSLLPEVPQAFASTVAGPLAISVATGNRAFDARLPLSDPGPAKKLVARCADLAQLAGIVATATDAGCELSVPTAGVTFDLQVEGNELRLGTKGRSGVGDAVAPSAVASELASGAWSLALWARGTLLGPSALAGAFATLPSARAAATFRALAMLSELGIGLRVDGDRLTVLATLRTTWANPDDVVSKLAAIKLDDAASGRADVQATAIAAAAPGSPFARDRQVGYGGVMAATMVVGLIAALAIPAVIDHMKIKKVPIAAEQNLDLLAKHLDAYYAAHKSFPTGAVITPGAPCCEGPHLKCPADPAAWAQSPIWSALGFAITEPSFFQYGYHSDGHSYTATAIGDLDCDGVAITWRMTGEVVSGQVKTTLTPPPPNAD